jgi:hypothetical protein
MFPTVKPGKYSQASTGDPCVGIGKTAPSWILSRHTHMGEHEDRVFSIKQWLLRVAVCLNKKILISYEKYLQKHFTSEEKLG